MNNNSWLSPFTVYEYDGKSVAIKKSKWFDMSGNFPNYSQEYNINEVEIESCDGTIVPLSIIYSKNIVLDGSTPCFLYGYEAYGISIEPFFIIEMATFLE